MKMEPIRVKITPEAPLKLYSQEENRHLSFDETMVHVGRAQGADITAEGSPNRRYMARRQAVFVYTRGQWYLRDEGSKNGTYVNGIRLPAETLHPLKYGDQIRFANLKPFIFETAVVLPAEPPKTGLYALNMDLDLVFDPAFHADDSYIPSSHCVRRRSPGGSPEYRDIPIPREIRTREALVDHLVDEHGFRLRPFCGFQARKMNWNQSGPGEWQSTQWQVACNGTVIVQKEYRQDGPLPGQPIRSEYIMSPDRFAQLQSLVQRRFPLCAMQHGFDGTGWEMTSYTQSGQPLHHLRGYICGNACLEAIADLLDKEAPFGGLFERIKKERSL